MRKGVWSMDCPKCKTEMKEALISAAVGGVLNVANPKRKLLDGNKTAGVDCFGCPNCDFMTWDTPVSDKCPKCNDGTTLFKKGGKLFCLKEGCGYEVAVRKEK